MITKGPLLAIAAMAVVTLVVAELIAYRYLKRQGYAFGEALASLTLGVASKMVAIAEAGCIGAVSYLLWSYRIAEVPLDSWWGWLALFLGVEFFYYWYHRAAHSIRWLWASHSVHHSPEHLNVLASIRLPLSELLVGRWLFFMPLVLFGFHPVAVFTMWSVNTIYQIWIHNELIAKLGPLEYILNTPSNHRVHHALNTEYIDRNYGGILIVFDRLFGTYVEERRDTPCRYGLLGQVKSNNAIWIAVQEWVAMARDLRRSSSLREAVGYLLGKPGWRPKPQQETSEERDFEERLPRGRERANAVVATNFGR